MAFHDHSSDESVRGVDGDSSVASLDVVSVKQWSIDRDVAAFRLDADLPDNALLVDLTYWWNSADPDARSKAFVSTFDAIKQRVDETRPIRFGGICKDVTKQVDPLLIMLQQGATLDNQSTSWLHERLGRTDFVERLAEDGFDLVCSHALTTTDEVLQQQRMVGIEVANTLRPILASKMDAAALFGLEIAATVPIARNLTSTRLIPLGFVLAHRYLSDPISHGLNEGSIHASPLLVKPNATRRICDLPLSHTLDFGLRARLAARLTEDARLPSVALGSLAAGAVLARSYGNHWLLPVGLAGTAVVAGLPTRLWQRHAYVERVNRLLKP